MTRRRLAYSPEELAQLRSSQSGPSWSGYAVPNSCFSAAYDPRPARIAAGLAKKIYANARNLKKGELAELITRLPNCRVEIEKKN